MKNKSELSVCLLCIIEAVCYFVPFCLVEEYWEYQMSMTYHGRSKLTSSSDINIFGVEATLGKSFAILLLLSALTVAVVYLLRIMGNESGICKRNLIVSIVHTVIMSLFYIYSCGFAKADHISYRYEYSIGWLSFVIITLNVIALVLAVLITFGRVRPTSVKVIEEPTIEKKSESVDDLKAYKELLDTGVITQEEFDKKKKEFLGL